MEVGEGCVKCSPSTDLFCSENSWHADHRNLTLYCLNSLASFETQNKTITINEEVLSQVYFISKF